MRSATSQLDVFRASPAELARVWREAAEASAKQYPDDHRRYRHYADEAERYEAMAQGVRQEAA